MVFLDETGILLGLMRHHAHSKKGNRVYDLKTFYRGKKVTVIGAISMNKVLAVMTMDNSMDSNAFHLFIEKFWFYRTCYAQFRLKGSPAIDLARK